MAQCTNHILMVRPTRFGYDSETALDNSFQQFSDNQEIVQAKAVIEFENLVKSLTEVGVTVHVIEDTKEPHTPNSIFPNNWISFHEEDATICVYPMFAKNRRLERKSTILSYIEATFEVKTILDLTRYEGCGKYLEGTGSMVLDRENHIAFASISQRTDEELFEKYCKLMEYQPITFHAEDETGKPIYHTNVVMAVMDRYAIVCFEAISDPSEREMIRGKLEDKGKVVINLAYNQLNSFAGNMLQVKGLKGRKFCVMSTQAYKSLDFEQIEKIEKFDSILHSDLENVESNGGGSARCMMAEIFLKMKNNHRKC